VKLTVRRSVLTGLAAVASHVPIGNVVAQDQSGSGQDRARGHRVDFPGPWHAHAAVQPDHCGSDFRLALKDRLSWIPVRSFPLIAHIR
jgi:hypothetical protein